MGYLLCATPGGPATGLSDGSAGGIKYQTFAAWVARRRKQRGLAQAPAKRADPVHWLEAVVSQAKRAASHLAAPLRVRVSTGAWIEISDLDQVSLALSMFSWNSSFDWIHGGERLSYSYRRASIGSRREALRAG